MAWGLHGRMNRYDVSRSEALERMRVADTVMMLATKWLGNQFKILLASLMVKAHVQASSRARTR
eukprot:4601835-Amphidinium_carterae.1